MTENEPIKTVSDGITFLSTGRYYDGINRRVAHKLKDGDNDAIDYAARQIAKLLPQNAVLVPIPGHHGKAEQTMQLVTAISSYTRLPIVDALRGIERDSQYPRKEARLFLPKIWGSTDIKTCPRIVHLISLTM